MSTISNPAVLAQASIATSCRLSTYRLRLGKGVIAAVLAAVGTPITILVSVLTWRFPHGG